MPGVLDVAGQQIKQDVEKLKKGANEVGYVGWKAAQKAGWIEQSPVSKLAGKTEEALGIEYPGPLSRSVDWLETKVGQLGPKHALITAAAVAAGIGAKKAIENLKARRKKKDVTSNKNT